MAQGFDETGWRATPEYADGFWARAHGKPFDCDRNYDEGYCEGWRAADRSLERLTAKGECDGR